MNEKDPFLACDYNFKKKGVEEGAEEGDFFFWKEGKAYSFSY